MARGNTWTNSDGLEVGFGRRDSEYQYAGTVRTQGNEEMITLSIKASEMPLYEGSTVPSKAMAIPAGSYITKATLDVITTFADADANPTMTIGLVDSTGTAIDIDGIFAGLTEASGQLTAPQVVEGDVGTYGGLLVNGTEDIGTADGYITADLDTGAWDSGEALLTVWYLKPMPSVTPTDPITTIVGSL